MLLCFRQATPRGPRSADRPKQLPPRARVGARFGAAAGTADSVRAYADRLLDVHFKDVTAASAEGRAVEVGRGVIDIPQFLQSLLDINYTGILSLEYEKDGKDPLPGAAESVGFVKGVLSAL